MACASPRIASRATCATWSQGPTRSHTIQEHVMSSNDKAFTGSIPETYERYLVPLIFEPYADDIVRRLEAIKPKRILEVAAGTGVVTRRMAAAYPDAEIVATDLN